MKKQSNIEGIYYIDYENNLNYVKNYQDKKILKKEDIVNIAQNVKTILAKSGYIYYQTDSDDLYTLDGIMDNSYYLFKLENGNINCLLIQRHVIWAF